MCNGSLSAVFIHNEVVQDVRACEAGAGGWTSAKEKLKRRRLLTKEPDRHIFEVFLRATTPQKVESFFLFVPKQILLFITLRD